MNRLRRITFAALAALIAIGPGGLAAAAGFCRPRCYTPPISCEPVYCEPTACEPAACETVFPWEHEVASEAPGDASTPAQEAPTAPPTVVAPVEATHPLAHEEPSATPPAATETLLPPMIASPPGRPMLQPAPLDTPYHEEPPVAPPADATLEPPAAEPAEEAPAEPAADPIEDLFRTPAPAATPATPPAAGPPAVEQPAPPTFVSPTTPSEMPAAPSGSPAPAQTAPREDPPATPTESSPPTETPMDPSTTPEADDLFDLGATLRTLDEQGGWSSDATRTWTDATGRFDCAARLVEATGDAVTLLRADGRAVEVSYEHLSITDLEFVHRQVVARRAQFAAEGRAIVAAAQP